METNSTLPELQKSVSAVIRQGLTVLLMLVVSGLLGFLPGADILLFGRLTIVLLLRAAMAAAMAVLLLSVRRQAVHVVRHFLMDAFFHRTESSPLDAPTAKLATNVIGLVYVCLLYWLFIRGFGPLVGVLTAASWPFTLVRLCALAAAVVAIIGIFVGASPLFGHAGVALANRVAPAPELTGQVKCAGCGVLDDGGSRFCRFCGRALAPEDEPNPDTPPAKKCTRCGAAVVAPARFCPACGKPA
jgi:hypothetical protein